MKKFYLSLALLALFATGVQAQTLLDEDFETSSTESYSRPVTKGSGWTTIDSYTGTNMSYKWSNTYGEKGVVDGSKHAAACDGALFESSTEGKGPREEILLSPELNLDNTYQLKFDWKVGPMASMDNSKYDLQVRVVENDDMANAITVFSIQDQNLLKESGVLTYPITTWDPHTSEIDLSYFKGKKVKLAFVYKMLYPIANIAYIDNVTVKQFTPPTQPVPVLSDNAYKFPAMYIGEKFYTTLFTLTNQGTNGLKVTGIDLPQGVTTTWDYKSVDLAKYESTRFQLAYTASLTSPVKGDVVVHTNGGDVTVALSAEKMVVPEGYQLESFNDYFPPAGWKNNLPGVAASRPQQGRQAHIHLPERLHQRGRLHLSDQRLQGRRVLQRRQDVDDQVDLRLHPRRHDQRGHPERGSGHWHRQLLCALCEHGRRI